MQRERPVHLTFRGLRRTRRLMELSFQDLAEMSGLHRQTLWAWEAGRAAPGLAEFVAVARALGKPLHELFEVTKE